MNTKPALENQLYPDGKYENTIEFLRTQIKNQVTYFAVKQKENRNWAFILRLISIILGTLVTILLGIQILFEEASDLATTITVIALIVNAIATFVNAAGQNFGFSQIWILYTITSNSLRRLESDLQYLETKMADDDLRNIEKALDKIYDEYSEILENTNKVWEQIRQQRPIATSIDTLYVK